MEPTPVSLSSAVMVCSVVYCIEEMVGCDCSVRYIISCSTHMWQCIV